MLPRRNWTPYAKCSQNLVPATKPQQVRLASGLTRFAATPIPCVTVGPTNGITTNERHQEPSRSGLDTQRPSGRFQASFIGSDRKRHFVPTTFSNRMRAERWLANERDLIERAAESGERWLTPDERDAKAA